MIFVVVSDSYRNGFGYFEYPSSTVSSVSILRAAITRNWTQDTGEHDEGQRVKAGMTHAGVAVLGTYVDVVIDKQS